VCAEVELRMLEESEFQTVRAAMQKTQFLAPRSTQPLNLSGTCNKLNFG